MQFKLWLFIIIIGLADTLGVAQSNALRGQVTDPQQGVIADARVTVSFGKGEKREQSTNENGEFVFQNFPNSEFRILIEAVGFLPYEQKLGALPDQSLNISLQLLALTEEQQITATVEGTSVEPDQNLSGIVLEGEALQELLPEDEEEMREMLETLAGPMAAPNGGSQIIINGFRGGRLPPKAAIQQVRVNQNPYSAEFSQSGFARTEIITKPGNDQWRGSISLTARNTALDARNAFALERPVASQNRWQGNLSGPLIKQRLSFFLNAEDRRTEGAGLIVARTLDGTFVANVPAPSSQWGLSARADYLLTKRHTLNGNYEFDARDARNREFAARFGGSNAVSVSSRSGFSLGGGNYTLPDRGSNAASTSHTLRLAETFIINAALLSETRLAWDRDENRTRANTEGPAINVLDAFLGGGSTCCPSTTKSNTLELQQYFTLTRKRHTMRLGWQQEHDSISDESYTNFNGTFTFANLEQYRLALAGQANAQQYTENRGNPKIAYGLWRSAWFLNDDWRVRGNFTLSLGMRHEFQTQLSDRINFAPRIGIAWAPFKKQKSTVRIGGGLFYSRLANSLYETTLRYNGVNQQSIVIANAPYPDPFAANSNVQTRNTVRRQLGAALNAPYAFTLSSSFEQALPFKLVTATTYVFSRGLHQFRMRNVNAPFNGLFPLGNTGALYQIETTANSQAHNLQIRLDRRFGRSFSFFNTYALGWLRSDGDGATSLPANSYDLRNEWARSLSDRRHNWTIGGRVSLPWNVSVVPFMTLVSGAPFNITLGTDENGDTVINDRPLGLKRNSDLAASLYGSLPERCLLNCRTPAEAVSLRTFLKTNFPAGVRAEGPGSVNVNLRLSKTFSLGAILPQGSGKSPETSNKTSNKAGKVKIGEKAKANNKRGNEPSSRYQLTLSASLTNLFNHVNFGQYSGVLSSPFFGKPNSAAGARQVELSLRFSF